MRHFRLVSAPQAIFLAALAIALVYLFPGPAFAADFDGDGIDDAFDNCPSTYNPAQLNTDQDLALNGASVAGDALGNACDPDDDDDSMPDDREIFLGTSPLDNCGPHGWWADTLLTGTINIADVLALKPAFGSSSGDPAYRVRHDLADGNGTINIADVLALKFPFGQTCTQATGPLSPPDNGVPNFNVQPQPPLNAAANCGGGPSCVYLHSGESAVSLTLMSIPGRRLDYIFVASYRSGVVEYDTPLGYGWDFNHNRRLLTEPDSDVVLISGTGRIDTYSWTGSDFTAPQGHFSRLILNGDTSYTERLSDGTVIEYDIPDANDISRIESVTDRNDNTTTYTYDGLDRLISTTDSLGRDIDYEYNVQGRLETVTDFTGRSIRFLYDGEYDLVKIISPTVTGTITGNDFPDGRQTRFEYDANENVVELNHNLIRVTAPNETIYSGGPPLTEYTYDSTDRVVSETTGGTNNTSGIPAGGTFTYDYSPSGGCSAPEDTCLTDPNGNDTDFRFNLDGAPTRSTVYTNRNVNPSDPATFVTEYFYDTEVRLTRIVLPEGNSFEYDYDAANPERLQQGNLIEVREIPDAGRGGDQSLLTTTYTYEPIYNLRRTVTDPRGNDPTYVPQNGGAQSAARYTTTFAFDYEEDCDTTAIGAKIDRTPGETATLLSNAGMCGAALGDVNGDADVSQVSGNVIRIEEPTVNLLAGGPQALEEGTTSQIQTELIQMNLIGQPIQIIDPELNVHEFEYYSEQDPDGNGVINNPGGDPTTGGYLKQTNSDTTSDPGRDTSTNPTPVDMPRIYEYNDRGALTLLTDGRGTSTALTLNALDEVVQVSRADSVGAFVPSPPEVSTLVAEAFTSRYFYDYNGNLLVSQSEDRGNTSQSDGNLPSIYIPPFVPDPDPVGGIPYLETTYEYDIMNRITRIVGEPGNVGTPAVPVTEYRYDRNGNLGLVLTPTANLPGGDPDQQPSNVRSYLYDERDLLFTDTRGGMTAQFRGESANADIPEVPGTPDSPDISTSTFDYDGNANRVRVVDAEDTDNVGGAEETRFLYDGFDRLVSGVDAAGNQSYNQYDPASMLVSTRMFGPVGGATPTSNAAANFTQPFTLPGFTQPELSHTDYLYDEVFRFIEMQEYLFVAAGTVTNVAPVLTDGPLGGTNDGIVVTRYDYDRNDRMTFRIEDDTDTSRVFYDGYDRVIRSVDPENNEKEFAYDDNSNLIEIRELDVAQLLVPPTPDEVLLTTYEYDSMNRLTRVVDNIGRSGTYAYDSRDNVTQTADAEGPLIGSTITRRAFTPGALTVNNVNEPGNTVNYLYDGLDRRIATVADLRAGALGGNPLDLTNPANPDGRVVTDVEYDVNSRAVSTADDGSTGGDQNVSIGVVEPAAPLGNVTRTVYDDLNRVVQYQYDDGTSRSYVYDRDDNVVQETDQNGSVFAHTYDAIDRLVSTTITRGPGVVGTTSQTYEYDGLNRLTRATDNNDPVNGADDSTITRAYDSLSRRLEEAQQIGLAPANVVAHQWAGDDNMLVLIYPDSRQVSYTYDGLDRTATVQSGGEPLPFTEYSYIGTSRVLERRYQDPFSGNPLVRLTYRDPFSGADTGYDGARRPVVHQHLDSVNNPISAYEYQFGRMNQVEREGRIHANRENVIEYDSLYRVVDFQRDLQILPPGPPASTQNYQLDGNSNWANLANPNNMNEYDFFLGQPRVYDDNGNLTDDNTTQYAFDAFNRLVDTTDKFTLNPTSHHTYDAAGRSTSRQVVNSGPLNDFFEFSYAGSELVHENRGSTGLQQYIPTGAETSSGKADLFAGVAALREDRAVAPGQPTFFHEDGTGNVGAITDPFQNVTERYTYDAFGVPQFEDQFSNPLPVVVSNQGNPFLYQGIYWEPENELFDVIGTSYKPDEGRTLSHGSYPTIPPGYTPLLDIGGSGSGGPILLEWEQWHAPSTSSNIEVVVVSDGAPSPVFGVCGGGGVCGDPDRWAGISKLIDTDLAPGLDLYELTPVTGFDLPTVIGAGTPLMSGKLEKILPGDELLLDDDLIMPAGTGSYSATDAASLDQAFQQIITGIVSRSNVAFSPGTIQNDGLFSGSVSYVSSFRPFTVSVAAVDDFFNVDYRLGHSGVPILISDYIPLEEGLSGGQRSIYCLTLGPDSCGPINGLQGPHIFGYVQDMPVRDPIPDGPSLAGWETIIESVQFGYVRDMPVRDPIPDGPTVAGRLPPGVFPAARFPVLISSGNNGNTPNWTFGYVQDMPVR
jgi:YD repeat-containing protein